jgi:hypothetical protein
MPEICRFYGIIIRMFFSEHQPPHFHAVYGSDKATIDIETLAVISGKLPPRATGLVIEWASSHRDELLDLWDKAQKRQRLGKLDPLK